MTHFLSPPRLNERVSPGHRFLLGMFILFGQIVVGGLTTLFTDSFPILLLISTAWLLFVPLLLGRWLEVSLRDSFALHPLSTSQFLWCVVIGVGLVPATSLLGILNASWIAPTESFIEAMDSLQPESLAGWAALLLTIGALVPLGEELLFRGILQESASHALGAVPAAIVVGLIFASAHFEPWYLIPLAVVGIGLGFVRVATGSVLACATTHGAYNLGATALDQLDSELIEGTVFDHGVVMLGITVFATWMVWVAIERLHPTSGSTTPPARGETDRPGD